MERVKFVTPHCLTACFTTADLADLLEDKFSVRLGASHAQAMHFILDIMVSHTLHMFYVLPPFSIVRNYMHKTGTVSFGYRQWADAGVWRLPTTSTS
jgi:hypothetical protein